ncbi:sorbitol dehydrogenase [Anabrus simplex]|uniref:sorbitol dehydrogenase n=1 Tax=Anabrus simplex TaxID=316456 RepID=UPI0035A386F8
MGEENLAAVLHAAEDLRLEKWPLPEPKENEVLVRMARVGICGSDVHFLKHGRIGDFVVKKPMVIGHESSGVVVRCGKAVTSLKPGDKVALEPGVPCRHCSYCKEGIYNVCPKVSFFACPPTSGTMARYFCHPEDFCFKLPDNVSLEEGALLEPLAVGVHSCRRGGVGLGSKVLVIGAGPIGLVTLLTAKAMGAATVILTDVVEQRLEVAKKIGADGTLLTGKLNEEEIVKQIWNLFGGDGPDVALDCSGTEPGQRLAFLAPKPRGVAVMVGVGPPEIKAPLLSACLREVDIKTIFRYCNDYPAALAMLASGKVNVKQLITHNYKLEEALQAFQTARSGVGNPIKIMVHCSQ